MLFAKTGPAGQRPPSADFSIDAEYMQSSFIGWEGSRASYKQYSGGFSRRFLFLGVDRREYNFAGANDNGRLWGELAGITAGLKYFRQLNETRSFMAFFLQERALRRIYLQGPYHTACVPCGASGTGKGAHSILEARRSTAGLIMSSTRLSAYHGKMTAKRAFRLQSVSLQRPVTGLTGRFRRAFI